MISVVSGCRNERDNLAGLVQRIQVALAQYVLKTSWEILATPLTYWVVGFLKRKENQDYYDTHTNFTPFRVKV